MEADDLRTDTVSADAAGERRIADRLDALEAERVLQRALELEAEAHDAPHVITTEQLERIAKEIGVDATFVHQALGEIRLGGGERSRFAQWVLPEDLVETTTISGLSRAELNTSISKWMTQNEGLIPAGQLADGLEWDIDKRWRAKAISGTLTGGNRISRVAGSDIAHRVHSVSDREHVVALQSKGRGPLLLAKMLMAAGATVAAVLLLGAIVSGDFLLGIAVALAIAVASVAGGVAAARWWARGIRGAFRRGLMGLANRARTGSAGWFKRRRKKS